MTKQDIIREEIDEIFNDLLDCSLYTKTKVRITTTTYKVIEKDASEAVKDFSKGSTGN